MLEYPIPSEHLENIERMAFHEKFQHLLEQARRRNVHETFCGLCNWTFAVGIDFEIQLGRKTQRPQSANGVLPITGFGVADEAQRAALQIIHAAGEVHNREIGDVVIKAVNGKIPSPGVFLQSAIDVVPEDAPIHAHVIFVFVIRR